MEKKSKNNNKILNKLNWRGIIKDKINEEYLEEIISNKNNKFYIGIDPTADSLHLGHYITIVLSKLIQDNLNIDPIFLIGGFTAQIGDPSGKNEERKIISSEIVKKNVEEIKKQISFLAKNNNIKNFKIINNINFYNQISIIEFFQLYGKNFNLNQMLSKESVKNRIDVGISYTEFSYQIFQGIDFFKLYKDENVKIQIGGSDQWGNIISGVELIRKLEKKVPKVAGITINLLTNKNGEKIGKSQKNNVLWLNKNKASSYNIYQYFIKMDDETAEDLIKKLTLIEEEEYKKIVKSHKKNPKNRKLQIEFAKRVITSIHSKKDFENAMKISELLFNDKIEELNSKEIEEVFKNFKTLDFEKIKIIDFLIKNNLLKSKREAREFLNNSSIRLNNKIIINEENYILDENILIDKKYITLDVGKKNKYLIKK